MKPGRLFCAENGRRIRLPTDLVSSEGLSGINLLVLAGGLGSRFGGAKQLAAVGKGGYAILDYSIRDACAAGIDRIVIVARSDLDEELRERLALFHPTLEPVLVHQDGCEPKRAKPWGTGHAVVSALDQLTGPVVIVNADDYYGPTGIARVAEALQSSSGDVPCRGVMLGFRLERTLPDEGAVSRGVCLLDDSGQLQGLAETHGIARSETGIRAEGRAGKLDPNVPVSMNIWGLSLNTVSVLQQQWSVFRDSHTDSETAEFLLPVALDRQRRGGQLVIDVLYTEEDWIGITNRGDLEAARSAFAVLEG